jgi:hypothetical protein
VIRVERKGAGNGVQLEVDGKSIAGNIIPIPPEGTKEIGIRAKVS